MKKKWNPFRGLTKRQRRILFGSGAGILGILLIIIIIYLCSGGKKKQSDLVKRDALGDANEATSTNDSKARGSSGKGLGAARVNENNSLSTSQSQDESGENPDNSENQKTAEKVHERLPVATPELVPQNTETKTPIAPKKESPKKQPSTSLKTCADYQGALAEALKKTSKKTDLETLYAQVQELCKGAFTSQDLVQYVKQQFEARKAQIFASERPTNNDLSELMVLQSNLKKLDNAYKPVKTLEQEFSEHFGNRFTVPFGKVETKTDISDGRDCALEAQKYFHAARTFCENIESMKHPAYDHEDLEAFVTSKIKQLLNPLNADVMKYIQILRYLNPDSPYAFPDCNDFAALQDKMAERTTAVDSVSITNGPLSMKFIKTLGDDQIDALIERCLKLLETPPHDDLERNAATSNKFLLKLVKLAREMDDTAQAWMDSGFHIRKSTEFNNFALKQLKEADRSKLANAMNLACQYHCYLHYYLRYSGFSDDSCLHRVENNLAMFLQEAFKSTSEAVLRTAVDFTSADTVQSAPRFVSFFEDQQELEEEMQASLDDSKNLKDKHSAIYRLIIAQLEENKIPKIVPGVNMNAPTDVREWYERVKRTPNSGLKDVLELAKHKEKANKAKNDMLPESERDNRDQIKSIYRPVIMLRDMEKRYATSIKRKFDDYNRAFPILNIQDALALYKDSNAELYDFLMVNQKVLEYAAHDFDVDYTSTDMQLYFERSDVLSKLGSLYEEVSLTVAHFSKENSGCVVQSDGAIVCENKFLENKLRELKQDSTWEGLALFHQFLNEAGQKATLAEVQALARTFLDEAKATVNAEQDKLCQWFGKYFDSSFHYMRS